jgi:sigma-B regulation protein RsbU (phosphoserine phosphatase)
VLISANLWNSARFSQPVKFSLIGLLIFLAIRIRDFAERLRHWVDRRFFREAFNAEQILGELSGQVRGILDRDALLQTVARKISDSLHVKRVAVMLRQEDVFRPAIALGYPEGLDLEIGSEYAPLAELQRKQEPVTVADGAPRAQLDAELLLPLASRGELLGFIGLGPKRSEEPYSPSDVSLLRTVATQTGLALENSQLSEAIATATAQRELLHREIEIAREVQQRLFPQNQPDIPALEYAGYCRPARGVGGDYYDFLALTSGRLGLAIADVSGKGIPAALLMASLQASTRGQSQSDSSRVADLTAGVNRLVCEASPENRYATFFYARFDPATNRLIYTNGGHNPPILLRGAEVVRLERGGPPVGLFKASQYEQEEIQLEPGDLLTLFTDGISEAENGAEEEWGEDRLVETARASRDLPPSEIIARIMQAADIFAAGAPQHDDMTLVIARVLPRSRAVTSAIAPQSGREEPR